MGYTISRWKKVKEAFINAAKTIGRKWYNIFKALYYLDDFISGEVWKDSRAAGRELKGAVADLFQEGPVSLIPPADFAREFARNMSRE